MNRSAAAAYLARRFKKLAIQVGQDDLTDNADGFGYAIDSALRKLGYAESDLASADVTDKITDYQVLLRYYALDQFEADVTTAVDYTTQGDQYKESTIFGAVTKLKAEAKEEALNLGYVLGDQQDFGLISLSLDILEPR
jgi:hypothetical protein